MDLMNETYTEYSKSNMKFKKMHLLFEMVHDIMQHGAIAFGKTTVLEGMHEEEETAWLLSDKKNLEDNFSKQVCLLI